MVVAEAKEGAIPRVAVAAKHGVTDAALKYHLYKTSGSTVVKSKPVALLPAYVAAGLQVAVAVAYAATECSDLFRR